MAGVAVRRRYRRDIVRPVVIRIVVGAVSWFEAYFATMPLHKWLITRSARSMYLDLKDTEWLTRSELEELQMRKLQRLLQHAYVHVPYYRDTLRTAGVHPLELESLDDVRRLPLLSKDDVRRHLHFKMFSDDHDKRQMQRITTSGSTGEPFTTYADRYQLEMRFATTLRGAEWAGWRFGDRQARLWHQTIGMSRSQIVRERIDAWFMRRLFIPAFEIDHDNIEQFIDQIRQHRPARRRLRGIAELPGVLHQRGWSARLLSESCDLVCAGATRQRSRRH